MLITHAIHGLKTNKSETPKQKINRIVTAKNQLLQPSIKNLSNPKLNIQNKQNENPNIKKSPSPKQQKITNQPPPLHINQPRQTRIKSQYYVAGAQANTKQSPIKKILFVKNLSYKSTKTSKNSSLDNKKEDTLHENKYVSLGGLHRDQSGKIKEQRRSYSHHNSTKSFAENESEIFVENRLSEKPIQDSKPKEMISQNNQSQAFYRMSPNELHVKMTKFNENYISQQQFHKFKTQKIPSFQYSSSFANESLNCKSIKMCPNIQSPGLYELQSFKNNKHLFQGKNETGGNLKTLISVDKEKKESLSSKKRTSRIKINTKNSQKHRLSINEENMTEESEIMISSPSQPFFEENQSQMSLGKEVSTNTGSNNRTKSTNSKNHPEESTLIETKKFDETFENLHSELSKASLSESRQGQILNKNPIEEHSVKHYCSNHPEKEAKFKVEIGVLKPYFCQKCTVLLVTQGYKIIENLESKCHRLQKLKSFICQVEILQPRIKITAQNLTKLQSQVYSQKFQAQTEIQTYYTSLIQSLESHKQTAIKSLNYHTTIAISQLEMMKKNLIEHEKEINFLKDDILPNVDLIINEERLPAQSWKHIIFEHEEKLQGIERIVDTIGKTLAGQGDNKVFLKNVEIPSDQIKSALNLLQKTQIVFSQKILRLQINALTNETQQNSPKNVMNETKRSFSFDDENIEASFYMPSSKKKNLNHQLSPEGVQNIYELTDSIRLSFGNRLDNSGRGTVQSPTFKAI